MGTTFVTWRRPANIVPMTDTQQASRNGRASVVEATRELSHHELMRVVDLLEQIAEDRGLLLPLSKEERDRLVRAASKVSHPGRAARRQVQNAHRRQQRQALDDEKAQDELLLAETGIRTHFSVRQLKAPTPPEPFRSCRRLKESSPDRPAAPATQ